MRHRLRGKQLGRKRAQRKSLLRNLASDLVMKGSVTTTEAKGKTLRAYAERLVTIAKNKSPFQAKKLLQSKLYGSKAPLALVRKYKKRYQDRSGGYLRITRMGKRTGDKSNRVKVEWV